MAEVQLHEDRGGNGHNPILPHTVPPHFMGSSQFPIRRMRFGNFAQGGILALGCA